MTVGHLMTVAACAAIVLAVQAYINHRNRHLLSTYAGFAVFEAEWELGDLSAFDITARWVDNNVQVDFRPKAPGKEGRRYLISDFLGKVLSRESLPSP